MKNDFFINSTHSKFIEIRGEERADFLQGLITNDIHSCKLNQPIYSCLLTPQGKFLADFFIINLQEKYLIEIHEKYYSSFMSKLQIYKLRSKVEFLSNENIKSIIIFSKQLEKSLENIISFRDPRNKNIGQKIFYSSKNSLELNNLTEESYNKYKIILIKNLIPFTPDDLIENKSFLLENNFDKINAISWDKGCYVGQEITARMKYRALLKKQIYNLEIISGEIKINDEIILNNISIGKVISKVNNYLLCMLKIDLIKEKCRNKEIIEINESTKLKFL